MLGPVFRTYEPERDRLVAVKVFRLDLTPEQARGFADELQRLVRLNISHPGVVTPLGAGVEGTVAYLAEEYVAAESLDVAMRHYAPAPVEKALPFLTQLAAGIDHLRAAGVTHGALHPRDIFMTPDQARATGFGVAGALVWVGFRPPVRRPYSAPERIAGTGWDTRADVFTLAAIAYELFTGRRIAGASGQFTPSLGDTDPGGRAGALQEVLRKALADDPGLRYGSALAFTKALEVALFGSELAPARASEETRLGAGRRDVPVAAEPVRSPAQGVPDTAGALPEQPTREPKRPRARAPKRDAGVEAEAEAAPAVAPADDTVITHVVVPRSDPEPATDLQPLLDELLASANNLAVDRSANELAAADQEEPTDRPERDSRPKPEVDAFLGSPGAPDSSVSAEPAAPTIGSADSSDRPGYRVRDPEPPPVEDSPAGSVDKNLTPVPTGPHEEWRAEQPSTAPDPLMWRPAATSPRVPDPEPQPQLPRGPWNRPPHERRRSDIDLDRADQRSKPSYAFIAVMMLIVGLATGFALGYGAFGLRPESRATSTRPAETAFSERVVTEPGPEPQPARPTAPESVRDTAGPSGPERSAPPAPTASTGTRRAPPPPTGRMLVRSTPAGAEVSIDGVRRGRTPLTVRDLKYGTYTVQVSRRGHATESRRLSITEKEPAASVTFALTPQRAPASGAPAAQRTPAPRAPLAQQAPTPPPAPAPPTGSQDGSLYVESRPRGARLFIDQRLIGSTPALVSALPPGEKVIRIEIDGFKPWSARVQVRAGEQNRVTASLERLP